jgi:hypothetical protein
MGSVMVRCPETGRDIPTGIVTDRRSFEATPVFFARVLCPICRIEHEWFAKEAWVCEGEPESPLPRRTSWPGLSRPSTSCPPPEDVDARHKAGHDGGST